MASSALQLATTVTVRRKAIVMKQVAKRPTAFLKLSPVELTIESQALFMVAWGLPCWVTQSDNIRILASLGGQTQLSVRLL